VDIINLSLVLFSESEDLWRAIQKATSSGIVIICSTADQGLIHQHVWPAKYSDLEGSFGVIPIAAVSASGRLLEYSSELTARYTCRGENVTPSTASVGAKEAHGHVSGSSVATAMATGLACLTLACYKIANERRRTRLTGSQNHTVHTLITNIFAKMSNKSKGENRPWQIRPWFVFPTTGAEGSVSPGAPLDTNYTLGETEDFESWIMDRYIAGKFCHIPHSRKLYN
jgi:Subtilase family